MLCYLEIVFYHLIAVLLKKQQNKNTQPPVFVGVLFVVNYLKTRYFYFLAVETWQDFYCDLLWFRFLSVLLQAAV